MNDPVFIETVAGVDVEDIYKIKYAFAVKGFNIVNSEEVKEALLSIFGVAEDEEKVVVK